MIQMGHQSDENIQKIGANQTDADQASKPLTWIAGIRRPADFQRTSQPAEGNADAAHYGCDQNWYSDPFQQKAGCGPCAAANLIDYAVRPQSDPASHSGSLPDFIRLMHEVWAFVTPGLMGVHRARHLADGLSRYAREHQLEIESVMLDIPVRRNRRPATASVISFITAGLHADSPVAFLNRSNGLLTEPESWHWVTITALYSSHDGTIHAEIANYGRVSLINLSAWLQTTRLGGGFVYCRPITASPTE